MRKERDKNIKIFVYGTLTSDFTLLHVLHGEKPDSKIPATLDGFEKRGLNIYPLEDSTVKGYVLEVTKKQLELLDWYEGLPHWYKRIVVDIGGEDVYAYKVSDDYKVASPSLEN